VGYWIKELAPGLKKLRFLNFRFFCTKTGQVKYNPKTHEKHSILSYVMPPSSFHGLQHEQLQALL